MFSAFAVRQMTQDVVWQNGFIDLPWPGLDKEGCKFLEGNCKLNNANRDLNFAYNINILSAYPPVKISMQKFESYLIQD